MMSTLHHDGLIYCDHKSPKYYKRETNGLILPTPAGYLEHNIARFIILNTDGVDIIKNKIKVNNLLSQLNTNHMCHKQYLSHVLEKIITVWKPICYT
jgi:hypothetical protein